MLASSALKTFKTHLLNKHLHNQESKMKYRLKNYMKSQSIKEQSQSDNMSHFSDFVKNVLNENDKHSENKSQNEAF